MLKIEDIENLWSEDCEIDPVRLDIASLDIPKLHNKYLKLYNEVRLLLLQQEDKYNDLAKIKTLYYSGKISKEELDEFGWEPFQIKVLRTDIRSYLDADPDLKKIKTRIEYNKIILEYLKNIIEQINKRNFAISSAISWRKFTAGEA